MHGLYSLMAWLSLALVAICTLGKVYPFLALTCQATNQPQRGRLLCEQRLQRPTPACLQLLAFRYHVLGSVKTATAQAFTLQKWALASPVLPFFAVIRCLCNK